MRLFSKFKKFDKNKEENLRKEIEMDGGLEKNDVKAMILSAMLTILPVCFIALLGMCLLALWVFGAI